MKSRQGGRSRLSWPLTIFHVLAMGKTGVSSKRRYVRFCYAVERHFEGVMSIPLAATHFAFAKAA